MMENRYSGLAATGIEARSRNRVDSSTKEENVKRSYSLARQRVRKKIEREREREKRDAEKKRERTEKSDGSKLQEECKFSLVIATCVLLSSLTVASHIPDR